MIAPPFSALAPDQALPHRDVLLDAALMRPVLSRLGAAAPVRIDSCSLVRVNYQVGRSVRAQFRIEVDGVFYTVAARMFRGMRGVDAYQRSLDSAPDVGPLRGIGLDNDLGSVFWVAPNDRKINTLAAVLDPATPVPGVEAGREVRKRLVAYAPEKSATLVCEGLDGIPLGYGKVAAAHQAARDCGTYASLRERLDSRDPRLRLPRTLGYSAAQRTLWLEAVHGRRMAEATGDEETADLERFGVAVAGFHGLAVSHAPLLDRFAPLHLRENAAIIGTIRPDVSDAAEHLAARLIADAVPDGETLCLHGDLHPKNAIMCADRVALIDVEDVALGAAAADVGSLLASFVYRRETGRLSRDACRARMLAFFAGYETVRRLPATPSLQWHTAAAMLVERAARAVTRIRPLGLEHLPALLSTSEQLLDSPVDLP
jgi:tRNA A-37 threonylcarbamoyl transferase component Bud32